MKVAIIYYSETGNTEKIAEFVAKGVKKAEDIEAKCMSINEIDTVFLEESKIVFFGTPTHAGSYPWQIVKWFDTCEIKLAGKIGCVFATSNLIGGGAENAELSLLNKLIVKGMFAYSIGSSEEPPYTHFGAVCTKDGTEEQLERVEIFAERVVKNVRKMLNS